MSYKQGIQVRVTASTQAALFLTPVLVEIAGRGVQIREERSGLWILEVWMLKKKWTPRAARRLRGLCKRLSPHFSDPLPPAFQWEIRDHQGRLPKGEKRFFRPFAATERLRVAPAVLEMRNVECGMRNQSHESLVMQVGKARGTGIHPSTRTCLRLLEALMAKEPPGQALDVGTGTGILALAAANMGVVRVQSIDVDPHAVEVARRNAYRNGLTDRIRVHCRDLAQEGGTYSLVLANLPHKVMTRRTEALIHSVAPGGWLILGGIWRSRLEEMLGLFAPPLGVVQTEREAWWVGVLLRAGSKASDCGVRNQFA